jgi:hypothetical protein
VGLISERVLYYVHTFGQRPGPNASTLGIILGRNVSGEISRDPLAPYSITIPTTPNQDIEAQQCIDTRIQEQQNYNLFSNNCAQFVHQCLNAAGIDAPNTMLSRKLFNYLVKNY